MRADMKGPAHLGASVPLDQELEDLPLPLREVRGKFGGTIRSSAARAAHPSQGRGHDRVPFARDPDGVDELRDVGVFREIALEPCPERLLRHAPVVQCRQRDDDHLRVEVQDGPPQREAALIGEADVDQRDVELARLQHRERFGASPRDLEGVPVRALQRAGGEAVDRRRGRDGRRRSGYG